LEAELHDAFQDSHGPSPELALMEAFLRRHPGPSLEIGCGSGRLLFPLIDAGLQVEGLELSEEMLAMAKRQSQEQGLQVTLHHGDMDHWSPAQSYKSLLVPSFTLQLADNPLNTLRHWRSWLEPGCGLYLTTFMPYGELIGELPEGEWYLDHEATLPSGEHAILETRHELHPEDQKVTRHHRYRIAERPDSLHECTQTIHWAEPEQWLEWLEMAGFEVETQFLDWDPDHRDSHPGPEDFDGIITTLALATDS